MSDDFKADWTVRPPNTNPSSEYLHQTKLGCECLMCQRRRNLDAAILAGPPPNMQCKPEIPVTEEMRAAGRAVWAQERPMGISTLSEEVFRAMRAKEPPRDGDFQAMLKGYREQYALAVERAEIIAHKDRQLESMFTFEHVAVALAAKDARIAELDTELALLRRAGETLANIVEVYDLRSELFTNDADCAESLRDRAAKALRELACDEPPPPPPPSYPVVADPIPAIIADKPKPPKKHDPFNLPMKDHRRMGPE